MKEKMALLMKGKIAMRSATSLTLLFVLFGLISVMGQSGARAETDDVVVLKVGGSEGEQSFSLAELDALPQHHFTTTTVWTSGMVEFSGPALIDVLTASGAASGALLLRASNDYSIILEPSMVEESVPIVATRMDGQTFDLRNRGPLWLVFPYDSDPRFRTESTFAASIWQLTGIFPYVAP